VREEGGGGGAPGTRAEIPLQPIVKTMVTQVVPLQPMDDHGGADVHTASCGGPHAGACGYALKAITACREPTLGQAPVRNCGPWRGAHEEAGFLAGTVVCEGPMLEYSISEGLYLWKGPMLEQFLKNCSSWTVSCGRGPMPEQEKKVRRKEWQRLSIID